MALDKPDFTLDRANPNPGDITDAEWWLWLRLHELEPKSEFGGIIAFKKGFHAPGSWNKSHYPSNYSIRDKVNQSGAGWTHSSALDWTFRDAQSGHYDTISKYTKRLWASSHDAHDPRLDLVLFEFFGQADTDRDVEGWNEYREDAVSSDSSHLWHIHMSFLRSKADSLWGMWALLTVLMGWSVQKWRDSLPATDPNSSHHPKPAPKPTPKPPTAPGMPHFTLGTRTLKAGVPKGDDVIFVQKFIGPTRMGPADGIPGPKFTSGVKWYQHMRGLKVDGVMTAHGPTWRAMGVK